MQTATHRWYVALLLAIAASGLPAGADELGEKGKAIFKKNQYAVVTVQLVLKNKVSMAGLGGQSNESRQDVTGTTALGTLATVQVPL